MGSNTSKTISSTTSSSRNFRKRSSFKGFRGFHSYCLGTSSGSQDSDNEDQVCDQNKVDSSDVTYADGNLSDYDEVKSKSRLGIISGNISLGLRRFTSSRSSRPCPVSSPSLSIFDNDDDASGSGLPCCNMQRNSSVGIGTRDELDVNLFSSRIQAETDTIETRHIDRRKRVREPVEHKVRFSRTLSVGRLRDRVLRRSTFSDLTLQQERELRDDSQNTRRQEMERDSRVSPLDLSAISSSTSNVSNSMFSNQNYEVEISQLREGRSNFLERGRRIRSQARSLQRLSSRFENQSSHGRSCILSGQHRTGRCICRFRNRDTNSNDGTGDRASISRIVVLAEALFEVLDEIHQSEVLSSQPSASSLGCVPAPINVVESLPVKLYEKLHKHQEDATLCYICLVEYEDGDSVRVLPCHHEFHRTCIDKWLKEIHRVCPLCRGNICVSDSEL